MTTVTVQCLIEPALIPAAQTTMYTAGDRVIIDKCTVCNYSVGSAALSLNIVQAAGTASNTNLVIKSMSIPAGATYLCPEMVGQVLNAGDFISALAGTVTTLNIRISGRVVVG